MKGSTKLKKGWINPPWFALTSESVFCEAEKLVANLVLPKKLKATR